MEMPGGVGCRVFSVRLNRWQSLPRASLTGVAQFISLSQSLRERAFETAWVNRFWGSSQSILVLARISVGWLWRFSSLVWPLAFGMKKY